MLTNEKWENKGVNRIGSSRIRGRWVMKYCSEIEEFKNGIHYDAIIYQKAYWKEHMKAFKGIKIFDLCDPDWLDNKPIMEVIEYCDAITVPTEALQVFLKQLTDKPIVVIPDRLDPEEHINPKTEHIGKARSVVWFGYSQNQEALDQTVGVLQSKGLRLVVISDHPYHAADVNIQYDYKTINDEITKHDILLLPTYQKNFRHAYKSNNKTLTGWALKMPVANEVPDLDRLMSAEERQKEAEEKYSLAMGEYHSRLSGPQYIELIESIKKTKV